jgi:hypothetical protein
MALSGRRWFQIHLAISLASVLFAAVAYRAGEVWDGNIQAVFAAVFGWLAWRARRHMTVAGSAP